MFASEREVKKEKRDKERERERCVRMNGWVCERHEMGKPESTERVGGQAEGGGDYRRERRRGGGRGDGGML